MEKEPDEINKKFSKETMDVNIPIFMIGIKDKIENNQGLAINLEQIKKHIAIEIILYILLGNSSNLYNELYEKGLIFSDIGVQYEYARDYAHILIEIQGNEYDEIIRKIKEEIEKLKRDGIGDNAFKRAKKRNYGMYVRDFEGVDNIGNTFMDAYFKGINPFDFIDESRNITKEYTEKILREVFKEEKMTFSIISNN